MCGIRRKTYRCRYFKYFEELIMDRLQELLNRQKELDGFIAGRRHLDFDGKEWARKKCVAMIVEASELLDEIGYKWWKEPKKDNDAELKEEIIDILHFFLGICNDIGLSSDDIYEIYMKKNDENHKRQTGKSNKKGYKS